VGEGVLAKQSQLSMNVGEHQRAWRSCISEPGDPASASLAILHQAALRSCHPQQNMKESRGKGKVLPRRPNPELILLLHKQAEDDNLRDSSRPHDEEPEVEEGEGPEVAV